MERRFSPPVREGEELDVKIEAVGEKGDGIARKDGFVLFVPGVKEGDEVHIKVTRVLRKVGFAEVVGKSEKKEEESQEPEVEDDAVNNIKETLSNIKFESFKISLSKIGRFPNENYIRVIWIGLEPKE